MIVMRKFFIAVAAVGLLAGAACGSDDGDKPTATTSAGGGAPTVQIDAKGTTWEPDDVTVKTGEIVEWVVDGSIVHDLKGDEGVSHKAASKFTRAPQLQRSRVCSPTSAPSIPA